MPTWSDEFDARQDFRGLLGHFIVDTARGRELIASVLAPDATAGWLPQEWRSPSKQLSFDAGSSDRGIHDNAADHAAKLNCVFQSALNAIDQPKRTAA